MGGGIKNTTTQMMMFNSNLTINNVQNLASIVAPQRGYKITVFSAADIKKVEDTLPPKAPTLKGALKIHELKIDIFGRVVAKKLPSDPNYFEVNLGGSFAVAAPAARRLAQPQLVTFPEE